MSEPILPKLMREVFDSGNVKICFCTLCLHSPEYGHCYACPCGNHQPKPVPASKDEQKLLATVEHLKLLIKGARRDSGPKKPG